MWWVEVRSTVHRKGTPKLVPLTEVHKHTGFRTAFAFDDDVAALIREQGSTQGLRGQKVYADVLFVDFDSSDGSGLIKYLNEHGIAYERWDSGGRSVHLHVLLRPIYGAWVPTACKEWLRKQAPDADVSYIHPGGMYRLPHTYHSKRPGRCKTLIETRPGKPLEIAEPAQKAPSFQLSERGGAEELFLLLTQRKGEGHRSPHLWRLATTAAEAGCSFEETVEHAKWWNLNFSEPPHDEGTVIKQCESAFRRLARREA